MFPAFTLLGKTGALKRKSGFAATVKENGWVFAAGAPGVEAEIKTV